MYDDDDDKFQRVAPIIGPFAFSLGLMGLAFGTLGLIFEQQKGWFAVLFIAGLILLGVCWLCWISDFHVDTYRRIKDAVKIDGTR